MMLKFRSVPPVLMGVSSEERAPRGFRLHLMRPAWLGLYTSYIHVTTLLFGHMGLTFQSFSLFSYELRISRRFRSLFATLYLV